MIRLTWSFFISLLGPFIAWLGGYNFDSRGLSAVATLVAMILIFGFALTYPGKYFREK